MKNILSVKKLFLVVAVCFIGLYSCLDDDNSYSKNYPNALVTVKTTDDNSFFLQLDDETTLLPVNVKTSPYGNKEVRALVNYDEVKDPSGQYSKAVYINWIDSILTKPIALNLGDENDEVYGTDPVEIINDWVTLVEDGYLTLRFRTIRGDYNKAHLVNLISTNNPDNPYELEFRHNAYGDTSGDYRDGLVAFNLGSLPDTEGKTVKLKLKWESYSGAKSVEFDYVSRK